MQEFRHRLPQRKSIFRCPTIGISSSTISLNRWRLIRSYKYRFQDENGRTGRKIDFAIPRFRHSKTQFFAMALYDEDGKPVWYGPDSETGGESPDNGNYFKYLRLTSNLRRIDHLSFTAKPLDDMTGSDSPFGGGRDRSGGFGSGGFGGRGGPPGLPGSFDKDDKDGDDGGDHQAARFVSSPDSTNSRTSSIPNS